MWGLRINDYYYRRPWQGQGPRITTMRIKTTMATRTTQQCHRQLLLHFGTRAVGNIESKKGRFLLEEGGWLLSTTTAMRSIITMTPTRRSASPSDSNHSVGSSNSYYNGHRDAGMGAAEYSYSGVKANLEKGRGGSHLGGEGEVEIVFYFLNTDNDGKEINGSERMIRTITTPRSSTRPPTPAPPQWLQLPINQELKPTMIVRRIQGLLDKAEVNRERSLLTGGLDKPG